MATSIAVDPIRNTRVAPSERFTDPGLRVLVCDDHPMMRLAVGAKLTHSGQIGSVQTVSNAQELLEVYPSFRPHLVVIDVDLGNDTASGLAVAKQLRELDRDVRVVFYSAYVDPLFVKEALDAGAVGYLTKHTGPNELVAALLDAARGELALDRRAAAALYAATEDVTSAPALSPRELEVIRLAAQDLTVAATASQMGVSVSSIRTMRKRAYAKLGVSSAGAAVAKAMQHDLI